MKKFTIIGLCSLALSLSFSLESKQRAEKEIDMAGCQLISSQQAIKQAKARTGGKVVSIKLRRQGRSSVYLVRLLVTDKRIKNLKINACR